jgi:BirA family biotin operon repressor/biotin-[acetyl-CoA-carboxylase] ligase
MSELLAHAENLWTVVVPDLPGFTVEVLPSIDSTSSELMRRARSGPLAPMLLVALEQTAGRGRMGKDWHSSATGSLTFSLAMPLMPADWSGLSLAVGVSLAERLHPDLRLKWPNDLWWQQRKLGGILVETAGTGHATGSPRTVVIGVGLNIARPGNAVVAGNPDAMPPAGLAELHRGITAGEALERVVPALVRDVMTFETQGFAAFAERFARRDALRGLSLRLSDGTQGTGAGVDAGGGLLLQTPKGLVTVTSSQVSVRPC